MSQLPALGTCRCGATEIELSLAPVMTAACHCHGCQKMSASAFSLTAMVPAAGLRITRGAPVRGGLGTGDLDHRFCPDCKSWMFTRLLAFPDLVNVRPVLFDRPDWCRPFLETMTAHRQPWASTPAQRSYEGFPPPEDFADLLAAYATSGIV